MSKSRAVNQPITNHGEFGSFGHRGAKNGSKRL